MKPFTSLTPLLSGAISILITGSSFVSLSQPTDSNAAGKEAVRIQKRPPWTTSRITGSPEPPAPYRTERVFSKLKFVEPLELVALPGSDRFVLAEHAGKIYSFRNDPAVETLDVFADMRRWNREIQEVYSVTFHPQFEKNRYVYLWYILKPELTDGTRISRFKVTETTPPRVDLSTELVLFTWKSGGHNGGCARFGKDGMLYIATGDGVGPDPPDTLNTGQDIRDVLSSILRIDVDRAEGGKAYAIPPDNPFINTPGARPEVWAYGFRNPWRLSIDRKTGDVWTGDVGWELWEMIYRVEGGGNYGWSIMEGSRQQIKPEGKRGPTPILPPTFEHPHSEAASITGGVVYRGKRLADLEGAYIYGDFETGKIWALRHDGARVTWQRELVDTPFKVVTFGEDHDGEIFVVDFNGSIHQLTPNPVAQQLSSFPRKLSETGLFSSLSSPFGSLSNQFLALAPGVIPYSINAGQWLDGMEAEHAVALPGTSTINATKSPWQFPKDSVLVRSLGLPTDAANRQASLRKVETQILHFNGEAWNSYSYRWNEAQTDAELVGAGGAEETFSVKDAEAPGGVRQQTWRFSGRAECMRCHNTWCGSVLGFNAAQLDRNQYYWKRWMPGPPEQEYRNQLTALSELGVLDRLPEKSTHEPLARPLFSDDGDMSSERLNSLARTWLHVNCSPCHREHAGGSVMSFMNLESPLEKLNLVGARPMQGTFDMEGAEVVAAGDPYRSVLYFRISKLGKGHMPYIGSRAIDERGTRLIHDWIASLPPRPGTNQIEFAKLEKERAARRAAAARLRSTQDVAESDAIVDELLRKPSGALVLLHALEEGRELPASTIEAVIAKANASADRQVADLFERFVPEERRVKTLGAVVKPDAILSLKGDAERGKKLFFQPGGAQCTTCHRLAGDGRDFGPDLTQVGKKYTRAQLLESILEPSKVIDPKFVAYMIECKSGDSRTGFLTKHDSTETVIKEATGTETKIAANDIARLEAQKLSLMPEGLLQNLTAQEAADLVEFLASLK